MSQVGLISPSHRFVSTCDMGELHRALSPLIEPPYFSFLETPRNSYFEINRLELPQSQIFGVKTRSSVRVVVDRLSSIEVTIPTRGEILASYRGKQFLIAPGAALIHCVGESVDLVRKGICTTVFVHVQPKFLAPFLPGSVGCRAWKPRPGLHVLPLNNGLGRSLRDVVNQICSEAREWNVKKYHDRDLDGVLRYVLGQIIFRNGFVEVPDVGTGSNPPRYLERTLDFIHRNLEGDFSLSDLIAVAHVSARTLQRAFKDQFGAGPMKYTKQVRLRQVRDELLGATHYELSVSQVASKWGFYHGGNFAKDYFELFGEMPRETLRNR